MKFTTIRDLKTAKEIYEEEKKSTNQKELPQSYILYNDKCKNNDFPISKLKSVFL